MYVERCNLSTHAYPGEHSVMYTTAKSLYYIPETNIFHTNCIWIFKKKTMFHEDDIWIDHGFLHISQLSACWLEFNIFTFREITDKDFFGVVFCISWLWYLISSIMASFCVEILQCSLWLLSHFLLCVGMCIMYLY